MYQLDFVCIPSCQHAIIAHFGCSLLTSKPSYTGEKVITEFGAKTFISMRHSRRKNVIGQNQKEPEPKLHTHSSSPRIYTNDSITFLTTIYTLLTARDYGISCKDIHFNATFTKKKCDWSKSKRTRT